MIKINEFTMLKKHLKKLENKNRQNEMHLTTPEKLEHVKPKASQGVTGDKKIVKDGNDIYQYVKVEKQWYKLKLEKA